METPHHEDPLAMISAGLMAPSTNYQCFGKARSIPSRSIKQVIHERVQIDMSAINYPRNYIAQDCKVSNDSDTAR
jgi:hypothetical protein